ncbi:MAG: exodeoxyribonuclease VII small subunit [Clostridiales bacterium]|nr:exodeoxyribonuclease VII small subunit [Clostridiales bacterium]HBM79852.1 exodeoxyribonuclease VII small subunit [Clostridiaceae bacterium]
MAEKKTNNIKFEDALERLEEIIKSLQDGNLSLEKSMEAFQEGIELVKICSEKLDNAETKVKMLIKESNGTQKEVPFDCESAK